mgnify:CR=1 FL=1|tara:strand:- start:947 stop:1159 length:213 start_codon:yes stop_codon:yes gene_type:complete
MSRKLSTHYSEIGKGYCEVHFDYKEEYAYIKYYDNNDKKFYEEEFPHKSLVQVQTKAEDWCAGSEKLIDM